MVTYEDLKAALDHAAISLGPLDIHVLINYRKTYFWNKYLFCGGRGTGPRERDCSSSFLHFQCLVHRRYSINIY